MDTRATMLQITKHRITLLEWIIIVESEVNFRNDIVVVPREMMILYFILLEVEYSVYYYVL